MKIIDRRSTGFTLIEVMISLAIGVIVVATGFTIYVQTIKVENFIQAELSLQSNSYFIHQTLRQFVNQAGYRALDFSNPNSSILPIKLTDNAFSGGDTSGLTQNTGSIVTFGLQADSFSSWQEGQYIRVDTDGFSIKFEGSSDLAGVADGSVVNCQGDAIESGVVEELNFSIANGAFQCTSSNGTAVELVSPDDEIEVEQLIVRWGVDTDNDGSVDEYRLAADATAFSEKILAARFTLLLSSKDAVQSANAEYTFDGAQFTSTDQKLRHELKTTVQLKH